MRLKVVTTALLIFGAILLLCWPVLLGPRPAADASHKLLAQWGARSLTYFLVTSMVFLSTAFGAVLIMRQNRIKYLAEVRENVRDLIEGSLNDHGKPKS